MINKTIKIPVYGGRIILVKIDDWKEINDLFHFKIEDHVDGCVFNKLDNEDRFEVYVCFKGKPTLSTIVHECVHVVNQIFEYRGVTLCCENDEHQAYFTEWVFDEVEQYFRE